MKLTKHTHACVELESDGVTIVIDPSEYEKKAEKLMTGANAVLITHEHADHFDEKATKAALENNPELYVYTTASIAEKLGSHGGRVIIVKPGDSFTVGSVPVDVYGDKHAPIYGSQPSIDNVAFFVNKTVYHPGDSFSVPDEPVDTLLLPVSGPWMKLGEAADFVLAVKPRVSIAIHDAINSDFGNDLAGKQLGKDGITGVDFVYLKPGKTVELKV